MFTTDTQKERLQEIIAEIPKQELPVSEEEENQFNFVGEKKPGAGAKKQNVEKQKISVNMNFAVLPSALQGESMDQTTIEALGK